MFHVLSSSCSDSEAICIKIQLAGAFVMLFRYSFITMLFFFRSLDAEALRRSLRRSGPISLVFYSSRSARLSNKNHNLSRPFKIRFTRFSRRCFVFHQFRCFSRVFFNFDGCKLMLRIALAPKECVIIAKLRSKVRTLFHTESCLTWFFRASMINRDFRQRIYLRKLANLGTR